jgi:2-phospho-L-lactate/phosphoenolpyruvate guanylyltransferase
VLPVKHAGHAKSRLTTAPGTDRAGLARAIALDCLAAVRACRAVDRFIVVTSDPVVTAAVRSDDVEDDPGTGLLGAVGAGVRRALAHSPTGPVAVLLADLPALRADDLAAALHQCSAYDVAFVPDVEGTGTVLLAATASVRLRPAFGPGSAARHESGGAVRLDLDLPSLRRDVDTWDALQQALALGVGPATTAALRAIAPQSDHG